MHIKSSLKSREIAGETIVILPGKSQTVPSKVLSFNQTAKFLWENLYGKEFSEEDAVQLLLDNYEVSPSQAATDVSKWLSDLKENDIFEG